MCPGLSLLPKRDLQPEVAKNRDLRLKSGFFGWGNFTVGKIYCKVRSGKTVCFTKHSHLASSLRSVLIPKKDVNFEC